jgi:hypothetical protein
VASQALPANEPEIRGCWVNQSASALKLGCAIQLSWSVLFEMVQRIQLESVVTKLELNVGDSGGADQSDQTWPAQAQEAVFCAPVPIKKQACLC